MRSSLLLLAILGVFSPVASIKAAVRAADSSDTNRYNVLFIAVDDLRPELGCYGTAEVRSPNIDRLSETGRRFERHFVQVPTCGASRYALLTGRCPSESGGTGNGAFTGGASAMPREADSGGARSFPELFRNSGYHTSLIGKISHQPDGYVFGYNGSGDGRLETPGAWDELLTPYGQWKRGWGVFFAYADGRHREDGTGYHPVMEFTAEQDTDLPDGLMASRAVQTLGKLAQSEKPFLLAVGFYKPHLPLVAPKKYWDMYEDVAIRPPVNPERTSAYGHGSGECLKYQFPFDKKKAFEPEGALQLKRAYYACVSYTDAQIGKLLDALDANGLADNTIVVLWGDHGWHLGENAVWGKHTPLERSLHSPLIIRVPGMARPGEGTAALAESVDIFPTLVDLCNLKERTYRWRQAGESLASVVRDPDAPGKSAAFGYWNGRTIRTDRYRLIAKEKKGEWGTVELYDHQADPCETKNVAELEPEVAKELVRRLIAEGDRSGK